MPGQLGDRNKERARVRSWVTAGLLQSQEAVRVTSVAASTPTLSMHTSCL